MNSLLAGRLKRWVGAGDSTDVLRECRVCGARVPEERSACTQCGWSEIAEYDLS